MENWLYGIVSLLAGVSALLLVLQKGVSIEAKLISISITLVIGLIMTYMSRRMQSERSAITDALEEASDVLIKEESQTVPSEPSQIARRLSNELRLTNERERLTFEYGDRFVFKLDEDAKFLGLNRYPEFFMGYNRIALLGVPLLSLATPRSARVVTEAIQRCRETQQTTTVELELRTKDGEAIDLDCTVEWSARSSAFYCVAQDITARKTIERYRAEVTAMLGHDLRGPLSSLTLLLDNAFKGIYGQIPSPLKDALNRAQQSTRSMVSLINSLLEADKLESSELSLKPELFYCEDLLKEASEVFQELSRSKEIALESDCDDVSAWADYSHSFQILSNLIANAIKFSPPHSAIVLKCSIRNSQILIEVSDQGPGVPSELKDSLFDRYKSKVTGAEPIASSGLGLFIARKLARLQGGEIGFSPNAGGTGTTFWFTLPQPESAKKA
jgi:PAS domain S-box-containing protein